MAESDSLTRYRAKMADHLTANGVTGEVVREAVKIMVDGMIEAHTEGWLDATEQDGG